MKDKLKTRKKEKWEKEKKPNQFLERKTET